MREELIKRGIELAWESLESHLDYVVDKRPRSCEFCGDLKHDKKCIRDYAEMIYILAKLL